MLLEPLPDHRPWMSLYDTVAVDLVPGPGAKREVVIGPKTSQRSACRIEDDGFANAASPTLRR